MRSNKSSKIKAPTIFGKTPEINKSGNKKSAKNLNQSQTPNAPSNFPLYGPSNFNSFGSNFGMTGVNPFVGQIPNFGTQAPNFGTQPPNFGTANINPFGNQPPNFGTVNINPFGNQPPNFGNPFGTQPPNFVNTFGTQPPNFVNTFGFNPQPTPTTDKEENYKDLLLQDLNLTSSILTDDESSDESFLSDDEKPSTSYQPPPSVIPITVQDASKAKVVVKPNTKITPDKSVTVKTSTTTTDVTAPSTKTTAVTAPSAATTGVTTVTAATVTPVTVTTATVTPVTVTTATVTPVTVTTATGITTSNDITTPASAGLNYVRIENFEDVFARIRYMNIVNGYLKRKHSVLPNCDLTSVKIIAQTNRFKMYHVKFDSFYFGCKQTKFKPQKIDFFKDLTGWNNWPVDQKIKPPEIMVQRILNDILYKKETQNLLLSTGMEYLCDVCDAEYVCYNFFTEAVDRVLTVSLLTTMTVEEKESVFVQLLCTLAVLHCKYGIVHSAIKLENIALKKVVVRSNYFKYLIGNRSFYVKNTGYIPLLCNFDQAYSVHPDYGSSEYYGIRNIIVEETGLKAGWGTRAGREYRQRPLKLSKRVTFDTTGKFIALEPNTTKILWTDGQEGTFNTVYEQNKEKIDLKDLRKHPVEDFFQDVDALLKIFAPYERLKMGNSKNKILYGINGFRYLFADLTAAYLFPEISDYGLYEREYVYKF
ncbi:major outer envelope glycoprotein-like protein [Lymphocystis disease virus 3]|uniref:Major outer envelope glycoprotein-like protein n=1 Tax=Lymphocystis disease virus 3 TaxID=2560566 RepID=A0A1B2RW38_9VIRU|nr:major outer envelope glycoprotein-like protein [Lymphocystis disease virus Sa]AOC55213.1 major outer envelope glycoprotein-like protein [Lymphocystis disease virus 3]